MSWRKLAGWTLAGFCLAGVGLARWSIANRPGQDQSQLKEVILMPPARVLRMVDLGYHSLLADLLFIRTNLYYGEKILADIPSPWLKTFIENLIEMDPGFKKSYLWGALATIYFKREMNNVPEDLIVRANQILELGMTRFSEDYVFPMRIAFNYYYELGDVEAALPYLVKASVLPGAPDWINEKLVDLYKKKGRLELARLTLMDLLAKDSDPMIRNVLRDRLRAIMPTEEHQAILQELDRLAGGWKSSYPYLPFETFLWVQEP
jgi:tetratricopeptide (TPR) repeat protein